MKMVFMNCSYRSGTVLPFKKKLLVKSKFSSKEQENRSFSHFSSWQKCLKKSVANISTPCPSILSWIYPLGFLLFEKTILFLKDTSELHVRFILSPCFTWPISTIDIIFWGEGNIWQCLVHFSLQLFASFYDVRPYCCPLTLLSNVVSGHPIMWGLTDHPLVFSSHTTSLGSPMYPQGSDSLWGGEV